VSAEQSPGRFAYRPALDGFRAVAVLAVIVYHLGYRGLPGGFIGVDMFFVLSGYLITGLLLLEKERTGGIDLRAFWFRRARRLLPAVLLMLVFVELWVAVTAPPFELAWRRRDILWTLFYGANWHFIASDQGYFVQFTSASPLRHAWSLAIEEQFYLVWPALIMAAVVFSRRHRRAVAIVCSVGIVVSVAASMWLFDPGDPSRSYYGTDTRMHQLLVGAVLATLSGVRTPRRIGAAGPFVGALGAAGLAAAFFLLDGRNSAYYFGLSAGLAVCAAALIWGLETAPAGVFARALSWGPVRWTGRISYGLYLWHWPVILVIVSAPVVLRELPGSSGVNVTRLLVTFGVAAVSFYGMEQPLRLGRMSWVRSSVPRFAAAVAVAVAAVAGAAVWATPTPPDSAGRVEIAGCPADTDTPCLRRKGPPGGPVVALIGDSIARSLDPAFTQLAGERGWTYVLAAANGCRISRLLTSSEGQVRPMDKNCQQTTRHRLERLLATWSPTTIVAIDRWEITDAVGPDGRVISSGTPEHISLVERSLADAARQLTSRGAHLVFIELPPILPPDCGSGEAQSSPRCHPAVREDAVQAPYNDALRRVARSVPGVSTMSITAALCPAGVCGWDLDGMVLRFDGLHFTLDASRWLVPALGQQLTAAGLAPE